MKISIEDFGEDFKQKFSQKHQTYIIDFCNTFQKTFPDIMDKETMIDRISWIEEIAEEERYHSKWIYIVFRQYSKI